MTGHQDNPTTGRTRRGKKMPQVSIEAVCRAAGIRRVRVVDHYDTVQVETALKEELASPDRRLSLAAVPACC